MSTHTFGEGNHLGDNWRAMLAAEMHRATPEHARVMPSTTQNGPRREVVFAQPEENPLTPEHVVWRQPQGKDAVLVGFDNGEVWHGRKVLNPATERRDVEEWSLYGHWHDDDG